MGDCVEEPVDIAIIICYNKYIKNLGHNNGTNDEKEKGQKDLYSFS